VGVDSESVHPSAGSLQRTKLLRVADSKARSEPLYLITTDEWLREYSEFVVLV
jgi:hypothetical protein